MDLFSRFTSEMIEATKTMVAECEAVADSNATGMAQLVYFQSEWICFDSRLVHRVEIAKATYGFGAVSAYELVREVSDLLQLCNCDADRIWFCEGSLGVADYQYTDAIGELWFVTGTEEEALEKIRATAEVVRQMENT